MSCIDRRKESEPGSLARWMGSLVLAMLGLWADGSSGRHRSAAADPPAPPSAGGSAEETSSGKLIQIPLPLVGSADTRIKEAIRRAISRFPKSGSRPTLVLELVPENEFGQGSDFGRALGLARFIASRELADVRTVAFIPRSIHGHGVLIASACEYIAMSVDAEVGDAAEAAGRCVADESPQPGCPPCRTSR